MRAGVQKTANTLQKDVNEDYREALVILAKAAENRDAVDEEEFENALERVKEQQEGYSL